MLQAVREFVYGEDYSSGFHPDFIEGSYSVETLRVMMTRKSLFIVLLVPTLLLLVPLVANHTVDGFNWNPGDYIIFWLIMVAIGFAYKLVTNKARNAVHCIATGIALMAAFIIVWGNLAVGFIGSEDNPANLMYFVALFVGALLGGMSRFTPAGMARAMFMTATAIFLVPVIALLVRPHDFSPGVAQAFGLNAVFAGMFIISGLLFRLASNQPHEPRTRKRLV